MARIVMKFGGTSMAGTERIRTVAKLVAREVANGNEVAVVVSAMAGETDRLVNFCREANPRYDPAEYDVVVAAGEQITSGLLALTLGGGLAGAEASRQATKASTRPATSNMPAMILLRLLMVSPAISARQPANAICWVSSSGSRPAMP